MRRLTRTGAPHARRSTHSCSLLTFYFCTLSVRITMRPVGSSQECCPKCDGAPLVRLRTRWAERWRMLVFGGHPVQCERCGYRRWIPPSTTPRGGCRNVDISEMHDTSQFRART